MAETNSQMSGMNSDILGLNPSNGLPNIKEQSPRSEKSFSAHEESENEKFESTLPRGAERTVGFTDGVKNDEE